MSICSACLIVVARRSMVGRDPFLQRASADTSCPWNGESLRMSVRTPNNSERKSVAGSSHQQRRHKSQQTTFPHPNTSDPCPSSPASENAAPTLCLSSSLRFSISARWREVARATPSSTRILLLTRIPRSATTSLFTSRGRARGSKRHCRTTATSTARVSRQRSAYYLQLKSSAYSQPLR